MGVYEVTQRQWVAIMDTNPSSYKCLDCPVEKVSWTDCKVFLEKLNALGIGKFRLPSEAEWEYSCRAGSTTKFYFGDLPDSVCKPEGGLVLTGQICMWVVMLIKTIRCRVFLPMLGDF